LRLGGGGCACLENLVGHFEYPLCRPLWDRVPDNLALLEWTGVPPGHGQAVPLALHLKRQQSLGLPAGILEFNLGTTDVAAGLFLRDGVTFNLGNRGSKWCHATPQLPTYHVVPKCMSDNVISYIDMCRREGLRLQAGMNFGVGNNHSVILMSVRRNAPSCRFVDGTG
jgi:hypothetical protein